jgi:hypothetical protein
MLETGQKRILKDGERCPMQYYSLFILSDFVRYLKKNVKSIFKNLNPKLKAFLIL